MAETLETGIVVPDPYEPAWGTTVSAGLRLISNLIVAIAAGSPTSALVALADYAARLTVLEAAISSATAGHIGFETKALMDADLVHAAGTLAEVTNDATPSNNGIYRKEGASGAGSWVKSDFRPGGLAAGRNGPTVHRPRDGIADGIDAR
ncbi:MAG: hypothetical protein AB9866_10850 [Syntrophobacteraceae bacterium]